MRAGKAERQERILGALEGAPSLRVAALARRLDVSTETIRRDLDEMTAAGLLDRTYGGAVRALSSEPTVVERHAMYVAERQRIAAAALPLLEKAQVVILASGSTVVHLAHALAAKRRDMTVITHSFGVAAAISANPTIKLLMLPGEYHAGEGTLLGGYAVAFLQDFYADAAVLGASGLSEEGPADALPESAAVYGAMVARAAQSLVVADHSKFGRVFAARYADWGRISHLVTDKAPEGTLKAALVRARVNVTLG